MGALNRSVVHKLRDFRPTSHYISQTSYHHIECEWETAPKLLNGTSFNDVE